MKRILTFVPAAVLALAALSPSPAAAQAPAAGAAAEPAAPAAAGKEKLVDISKVDINIQKTPQIQATNVKDKRWTPKDWIEIEVEATAELSKTEKDKSRKTYDEVTFKYYAYLTGSSAKKSRVLTGEIVHVNVPIKEKIHSVAYITPSQLQKVTEAQPTQPWSKHGASKSSSMVRKSAAKPATPTRNGGPIPPSPLRKPPSSIRPIPPSLLSGVTSISRSNHAEPPFPVFSFYI